MRYFSTIFLKQALMLIVLLLSLALVGCSKNNDGGDGDPHQVLEYFHDHDGCGSDATTPFFPTGKNSINQSVTSARYYVDQPQIHAQWRAVANPGRRHQARHQ